jgi:hypothetical protein
MTMNDHNEPGMIPRDLPVGSFGILDPLMED